MKHDQHRLAPLLQAIDREITERTQNLARVERKLEALKRAPAAHRDEISTLISSRSTELRELYRIEKELARLGIEFDAQHPRGILVPSIVHTEGESLSDTRFHRTQL